MEGRFNGEIFLRYRFGGYIFGGGYTWRGLFSEFYGIATTRDRPFEVVVSSVPVGPLSIDSIGNDGFFPIRKVKGAIP